MSANQNSFLLSLTGQIEKAEVFLKYCYNFLSFQPTILFGSSIAMFMGVEEGITQTSIVGIDESQQLVFNFPLDITWKSTNPSGWPQIVVHAYGLDFFGVDVVRGYGAVHIPLQPGIHKRRIPMFVPESSSLLMKLGSWFASKRPEFVSPKLVASGEGREVIKVHTQGFVDLRFNVVTNNLSNLGYEISQEPFIYKRNPQIYLPNELSRS